MKFFSCLAALIALAFVAALAPRAEGCHRKAASASACATYTLVQQVAPAPAPVPPTPAPAVAPQVVYYQYATGCAGSQATGCAGTSGRIGLFGRRR